MSTNSTFNLNFQLKFLKFRKWSLDSYEIIKVLISIRKTTGWGRKKSQATKASEVPAGPGTDTCSVQHCSENHLLLKGRGFKGRMRWGSGGEGFPPPPSPFQFWAGLSIQPKDISLNLENNSALNSASNLLWLCSAAARMFNI